MKNDRWSAALFLGPAWTAFVLANALAYPVNLEWVRGYWWPPMMAAWTPSCFDGAMVRHGRGGGASVLGVRRTACARAGGVRDGGAGGAGAADWIRRPRVLLRRAAPGAGHSPVRRGEPEPLGRLPARIRGPVHPGTVGRRG